MRKKAADYRRIARENLQGNWLYAVLAGIIASLCGAASIIEELSVDVDLPFSADESASAAPEALDGVFHLLDNLLYEIAPFLFVGILIMAVVVTVQIIFRGVILLGYVSFHLKLHDGQKPTIGELFSQFDRFGRAFGLTFFRSLYVALWSLLFVIPGIIRAYAYALAPYIMLENPRLTANECLSASKELMDGRKERLFCLNISFIGWDVLCTVLLATPISTILMLPIDPLLRLLMLPIVALPSLICIAVISTYRAAAFTAFYRDACEAAKPME